MSKSNCRRSLPSTSSAGFDWDDGNARKNEKHGVTQSEAEEMFFNQPLLLLEDARHGGQASRFHALGKTHEGRTLHITSDVWFAPIAAKRSFLIAWDSNFRSASEHRRPSKCSGDFGPYVLDLPRFTPLNCGSWARDECLCRCFA